LSFGLSGYRVIFWYRQLDCPNFRQKTLFITPHTAEKYQMPHHHDLSNDPLATFLNSNPRRPSAVDPDDFCLDPDPTFQVVGIILN
jgi:hypothetical protein